VLKREGGSRRCGAAGGLGSLSARSGVVSRCERISRKRAEGDVYVLAKGLQLCSGE